MSSSRSAAQCLSGAKIGSMCKLLKVVGKHYPVIITVFIPSSDNPSQIEQIIIPFGFIRNDTVDYAILISCVSIEAFINDLVSSYLRYTLMNCARSVVNYEPTFAEYYAKKRAEGKSYRVALSHTAKKLIRVLFTIQTKNLVYNPDSMR